MNTPNKYTAPEIEVPDTDDISNQKLSTGSQNTQRSLIENIKLTWNVAGWVFLLLVLISNGFIAVLNAFFEPAIEIWKVLTLTIPLSVSMALVTAYLIEKSYLMNLNLLIWSSIKRIAVILVVVAYASHLLHIQGPDDTNYMSEKACVYTGDVLHVLNSAREALYRNRLYQNEHILPMIEKTKITTLINYWKWKMEDDNNSPPSPFLISECRTYNSDSIFIFTYTRFGAILAIMWFILSCYKIYGTIHFASSFLVGIFLGWSMSRIFDISDIVDIVDIK